LLHSLRLRRWPLVDFVVAAALRADFALSTILVGLHLDDRFDCYRRSQPCSALSLPPRQPFASDTLQRGQLGYQPSGAVPGQRGPLLTRCTDPKGHRRRFERIRPVHPLPSHDLLRPVLLPGSQFACVSSSEACARRPIAVCTKLLTTPRPKK
jgi:hypothetical protein